MLHGGALPPLHGFGPAGRVPARCAHLVLTKREVRQKAWDAWSKAPGVVTSSNNKNHRSSSGHANGGSGGGSNVLSISARQLKAKRERDREGSNHNNGGGGSGGGNNGNNTNQKHQELQSKVKIEAIEATTATTAAAVVSSSSSSSAVGSGITDSAGAMDVVTADQEAVGIDGGDGVTGSAVDSQATATATKAKIVMNLNAKARKLAGNSAIRNTCSTVHSSAFLMDTYIDE